MPLFHQAVLALLYASGTIPRAPFNMAPTKPFGVPQVVSLSFWGGLWGIVLGLVLARTTSRARFWTTAIVFGGIAPTLVAILVAAPLKGQPIQLEVMRFLIGFLINAAWGVGTAVIYRLITPRTPAA